MKYANFLWKITSILILWTVPIARLHLMNRSELWTPNLMLWLKTANEKKWDTMPISSKWAPLTTPRVGKKDTSSQILLYPLDVPIWVWNWPIWWTGMTLVLSTGGELFFRAVQYRFEVLDECHAYRVIEAELKSPTIIKILFSLRTCWPQSVMPQIPPRLVACWMFPREFM